VGGVAVSAVRPEARGTAMPEEGPPVLPERELRESVAPRVVRGAALPGLAALPGRAAPPGLEARVVVAARAVTGR